MERLTKLNKKLYNNSPISQEYPTEYVTKNNKLAINKLAEYENFMEENGFESLEKLKSAQNKVAIEKLELLNNKIILGIKNLSSKIIIDKNKLDYANDESFMYANKVSALNEVSNLLNTMLTELKGDK